MDGGSIRLILIFVILVFMGAVFSCAESAVSLVNKIRIRQRADDGDKQAKHALYILNHFEKALTTLLICINVTHIASAAVATLLVARLFQGYSEGTLNLISTLGATVVVFLLGEMIPKALATDRSETMGMALAPLLRFLMRLLTPLTAFFTWIVQMVSRLFKADDTPSITEDELIDMIDTAEEEGVMDEEQSDLLKSAMQFSGTTVSNVMTGRDQIEAIDAAAPMSDILAHVRATNHSRLPVYEEDIDHIVGYLQTRAFLREYLKHPEVNVRSLLIPALFVKPTAPIDDLLTIMRQHKFYMAVVSEEDELGMSRTLGVVTIEDFLEELVGDIWDESDEIDKSFSKLGGNRYRLDTHIPVGEAFARMNCPPPEPRVAKMPVLAWIIENFRHIPAEGETFTYRNMEVTVDEVEGHRVSYVVIQLESTLTKQAGEGKDSDASKDKCGSENTADPKDHEDDLKNILADVSFIRAEPTAAVDSDREVSSV